MIGWLLKKANLAPHSSGQCTDGIRSIDPQNCALWHDVVRALEQSPRASGDKVRGLSNQATGPTK